MTQFEAGMFDAVVIGAGHAGAEAALALARLKQETLLLTLNLDSVGFLACNPSIGGTAKGHIVREIDALGGEMGICADSAILQLRMLNLAKGPAVHSLRAQTDKTLYHINMKKTLENCAHLKLLQAEVVEILTEQNSICGVQCKNGAIFRTRAVVVATGVYLESDTIIGDLRQSSGPSGFMPSKGLSASLARLGLSIRRFKTGTPARVNKRSIDIDKMERQNSDAQSYPFSFMTQELLDQNVPCYLTYTNQKTHQIIRDNLHRSPLYAGDIKGIGPRYCPSIEDKVVRFPDKKRHQIFIEPEGEHTNEVYIQGMSSSMPPDVQLEIYHSIAGLEHADIMRFAYAIEYDCIDPQQLTPALQVKHLQGLFTAGQINGSSGYEEAAGQGLVAGINAARYLQNKQPFILSRADAYIGVLIDDLVIKGTTEPYRMMTARAEYRLHLRQDNADQRLTTKGNEVGLVSEQRWNRYQDKMRQLNQLKEYLQCSYPPSRTKDFLISNHQPETDNGMKLCELLKRGDIHIEELLASFPIPESYRCEVLRQAEIEIKYAGYLSKQEQEIAKAKKLESVLLNSNTDYESIRGLRTEARQKLQRIRPINIGQAARISGVSPADITILLLYHKAQLQK